MLVHLLGLFQKKVSKLVVLFVHDMLPGDTVLLCALGGTKLANLEKEEEGDKAQVKPKVADHDYSCSICDVTFASAQVLQWHINEHNEVYVR